jgi:hypothetical protein
MVDLIALREGCPIEIVQNRVILNESKIDGKETLHPTKSDRGPW